MVSWWVTPCAAPGIMPVSTCEPAKSRALQLFDPIACWSVEQRDAKVFVGDKQDRPADGKIGGKAPDKIIIVGGGAAGFAATDRLPREGLEPEDRAPCFSRAQSPRGLRAPVHR